MKEKPKEPGPVESATEPEDLTPAELEEEATAGSDDKAAAGDWAANARAFIEDAARVAREDLADREITFEETIERAEEVIRRRPLAAVGVAAGVGLLAGVLMIRRH